MLVPIEIDFLSSSNDEWKKAIAPALSKAHKFEIHCWNEETAEISIALKFGKLSDKPWEYGKIAEGTVTEDFRRFILSLPKPTDTEIYNKMTPFFSIFLDDIFFSEHYGTELYKEEK